MANPKHDLDHWQGASHPRAAINDGRIRARSRSKAHSHELMNLIFELPYFRIQTVTERKIAVRQTASNYLKELVRVGVPEEKVVSREKLFIHPKLMRLLTRERNTGDSYS